MENKQKKCKHSFVHTVECSESMAGTMVYWLIHKCRKCKLECLKMLMEANIWKQVLKGEIIWKLVSIRMNTGIKNCLESSALDAENL